jgi:protocatechuate 3,4-dioxygenase beta subunit
LTGDFYVASARQGSRDVLVDGLIVDDRSTDLEVLVRSGAGVLDGKVVDAGRRPVHNATVTLLADPPGNYNKTSFYYRSDRTDQNGTYQLRGIVPGAYRLYAWSRVGPTAFLDDDFMKQWRDRGRRVQIDRGGRHSLDVTVLD